MDSDASPGRFLAFTTANSSTLQSSAASPTPAYRRHSSGSESGSSSGASGAEHFQHAQHAQPTFGTRQAHFGAENQLFSPPRRPANASATIYVDDPPYIPPEASQPSQNHQYGPSGGHSQHPGGYFDYHARMPPTAAHSPPQPLPRRQHSGGSSPAESVRSAGSNATGQMSYGGHGSASSGSSDNESLQASLNVQQRGAVHVQGVSPTPQMFNPALYPAYDASARRIGLEHVRHDSMSQDALSQSHYRPRTHEYPTTNDGPYIMSMSLDFASSPAPAPYPRQMPAAVPMPPSTPHIAYQTRGMTFNEDHAPFFPHPAQVQPQQAVIGHTRTPTTKPKTDPTPPDPTPNLRQLLGLSEDEEVSLWSLADPPLGEKPNYPYPTLIKLAIHGSPKKRLTLQEIYIALEQRFQWFRDNAHDKAWQNSIRHNLSLNRCFSRVNKPITEPGKGSYWVVDYSQGEGNKRVRKRNKRPTKAELAKRKEKEASSSRQEDDSSSDNDSAPTTTHSRSSTSGATTQASTPIMGFDDSNIDPALRNPGHVVGEGRARPRSARSNARRGDSPYTPAPGPSQVTTRARSSGRTPASIAIPQMVPQNTVSSAAGTIRQPTALPQPSFGQPSFGQPSFGQPAFGQPSFGQPSLPVWQSSFVSAAGPAVPTPRLGQPAWGPAPPQTDPSSGSASFMPMDTAMGVDMPAGRVTRSMAAASQAVDMRYAQMGMSIAQGSQSNSSGSSLGPERRGAEVGAMQQFERTPGQGVRRSSDSSSSSSQE